jgi:hypothetical protein
MSYGNYTARECYRSVGKGWWFLIRIALKNKPENIKIAQVKEKFGALRIYTEPYDLQYSKILNILESISSRTCEWCGNAGMLDYQNYWAKTLCESCIEKRRSRDIQKP